jgi:hypothetical protein
MGQTTQVGTSAGADDTLLTLMNFERLNLLELPTFSKHLSYIQLSQVKILFPLRSTLSSPFTDIATVQP